MRFPSRSVALSPYEFAEMVMVSWETFYRRSMMIALGLCSAGEYERMVTEKHAAFRASFHAALTGQGQRAMLVQFLVRARANARRLKAEP